MWLYGRGMKHGEIWRALDVLAAENGMSVSGLARSAGLDPTTFNRSKRQTSDGRSRWPSTESLARVLEATGATLEMFSRLVAGDRTLSTDSNRPTGLSPTGIAQAGAGGFYNPGPISGGWDEVIDRKTADPQAYALEISEDSMEPVFRTGDLVVVSPSAPIRCGDRVVVRTNRGETMAKQLVRRSAQAVELKSLNTLHPGCSLDVGEVVWMHRIVWVSQ